MPSLQTVAVLGGKAPSHLVSVLPYRLLKCILDRHQQTGQLILDYLNALNNMEVLLRIERISISVFKVF